MLERKLLTLNLENPVREFEVTIVSCPEKAQQLSFWEPQSRDKDKLNRLLNLISDTCSACGFFQMNNEVLPEKSWQLDPLAKKYIPQTDITQKEGDALKVLPAYGKSTSYSPRPTRLLSEPKVLSEKEMRTIKLLHWQPSEIIETQWWQTPVQRNYYLATTKQGEFYWVFKNNLDQSYYLHGYFD
jgi:protein ImuB